MDNVQELQNEQTIVPTGAGAIQTGVWLLELSLDWIVLRASENIHRLLGESHVTLIDEPLGRFVQAQPLHDLRNLFSRLSGTTGVGRAYAIRLTREHEFVDIAFQLANGRVLLEITPSAKHYGEAFGTVGGLIDGLADSHGQALLDGAARRMRALTGFDRATLLVGNRKATSDRSGVPFRSGANATLSDDFPAIVADSKAESVQLFPRREQDQTVEAALFRAPSPRQEAELAERGFASTMRVPIKLNGEAVGEFRLAHTTPCQPNLERHAAAELFAQLFALRLQIDALKGADQPAK